jgi:membrane protease YdiL (CAAX protease family)
MDENLNPYTASLEPSAIVQAEIVPTQPPGPGFWAALGCCLLVWGAQVAAVMAAMLVWVFATAAAGPAPPTPEALMQSLPMTLLAGAAVVGTLGLALLAVAVAYRGRAARILALRQPTAVQGLAVLLAVLPLTVVASEITNWLAWLLPGVSMSGEMLARLPKESLAAALVIGAVMPGLGEELFFRGLLGRGLVARFGPLRGIFLTSLLFGLVHIDPVQAGGAMALGLGIHAIYLATGSLWAPIVVHGLNNGVAFITIAYRDRLHLKGYIPSEDGLLELTPWPLLLAALAAIVGLSLVFWDSRTRWVLPDGRIWNPGYVTAEQPPPALGAVPQAKFPRWSSLVAALTTQAAFLGSLAMYTRWE